MKNKWKSILGISVLACVVLGAIVIFAIHASRPYSDAVTLSGIERGAGGGALVKMDDEYYELQATDIFSGLFLFDKWEQIRKKPDGDPAIMLRFGEEWIVKIYSDGKISAHYGYASSKQKPSAYYQAPVEIVEAISSFIIENGVKQEGRSLESQFLY